MYLTILAGFYRKSFLPIDSMIVYNSALPTMCKDLDLVPSTRTIRKYLEREGKL